MVVEELKQILFSEFKGGKHNKASVINVYVTDPDFIKRLVKDDKIPTDALVFLENNIQRITDVFNQITILFLEMQSTRN